MKNSFRSGNGHTTEKFPINSIADISGTMNNTYKKQMEMSVEMYNQLIEPFSKENAALNEDLFGMKFFKNNLNLFTKNIEMYSDFVKKLSSSTTDSFFKEKEINAVTDKMFESISGIYEKQIKQMKEFNNYLFEAMEKSTKGTTLGSTHMIENFKINSQENLDSALNTIKIILKPGNKKLLEEMNKQIDSVVKSNLAFWSDLMISMSKFSKSEKKETHEKSVKETKKEPSGVTHKK